MKVSIREIPSKGLELDRNIAPDEIGLGEGDLRITAPLTVKGSIQRIEDTALAQVEVNTRLGFLCARCLEPVEKDFSLKSNFDYSISNETEFLDLGEDIRQETIVNIAPRALCSDDCKGICQQCGVNLNKEECTCIRHTTQDTRHTIHKGKSIKH